MPAAAITSIIGATYGASKQASANKDAIAAQTQANNQALAFETQQNQQDNQRYADRVNRAAPYTSAGQNSTSKMAQLLGLPDVYTPPPGQPVATANPPASAANAAPMGPASAPRDYAHIGSPLHWKENENTIKSNLVKLRAPDGSIEMVNAKDVQHYIQLGATAVTT